MIGTEWLSAARAALAVLVEIVTGRLTAETRFAITERGLQAVEDVGHGRERDRGPAARSERVRASDCVA